MSSGMLSALYPTEKDACLRLVFDDVHDLPVPSDRLLCGLHDQSFPGFLLRCAGLFGVIGPFILYAYLVACPRISALRHTGSMLSVLSSIASLAKLL